MPRAVAALLGRLPTAYTETARWLLSTLLAFAALNLVLVPIDAWLDADPMEMRYGRDLVAAAYSDRSPAAASALLDETWTPRLVYRPFTETAERPRRRLEGRPPAERLIWSADLQEGIAAPLYVDLVHYGPRLADLLAADVVERMAEGGWLEP